MPEDQPVKIGAAMNMKIANVKVIQIIAIVLLVVFNFEISCPKKKRASSWYLCSGDFSFHVIIKSQAR